MVISHLKQFINTLERSTVIIFDKKKYILINPKLSLARSILLSLFFAQYAPTDNSSKKKALFYIHHYQPICNSLVAVQDLVHNNSQLNS